MHSTMIIDELEVPAFLRRAPIAKAPPQPPADLEAQQAARDARAAEIAAECRRLQQKHRNHEARRRKQVARARAAFLERATASLMRAEHGVLKSPPTKAERIEIFRVFNAGGQVKAAVWTVLTDRRTAAVRLP